MDCSSSSAAPAAEGGSGSAVANNYYSGRVSAAASLRIALDQRRSWVAEANAKAGASSPPKAEPLAPGEAVPLRHVVSRLLEEWGVESTDSEDDDDFCGWRVGSRALPLPGAAAAPEAAAEDVQVMLSSTTRQPPPLSGGFGVPLRTPPSRAGGSTSGGSVGRGASGGLAPPASNSSTATGATTSSCERSGSFRSGPLASGRPPGASPAVERLNSASAMRAITNCVLQ